MISLKDSIRDELAARFSVTPDSLEYLAGGREDSDGIVYTFVKNGQKYVLKIAAKEGEQEVYNAKQKLSFADYLGKSGVSVGAPLRSGKDKKNDVFEILTDGKYTYLSSVMKFIDGICPKTEELTSDVLKRWGALTGKMHKATKQYPLWENLANSSYRYGHEEEIDFFYNWCRNDIVKTHWLDVKKRMSELPISRDSYGFIHNDNHQNNIIITNNDIVLIDFDCANCHFFAQDIFLAIQGPLFDTIGGIDRPMSDIEHAKRFFASFLEGYETENHIDDTQLKHLGLFLDYRRLLLFTVMQGWMEADANVRNAFISMIENPCDFSVI